MTSPSGYLPTPREVADAARDTTLLVRLRWRMVRGYRSRVTIWFGVLALFGFLFAASSIGLLIRKLAEQGLDTAAGEFSVNYVLALNRGDLGSVGAIALGSALAAALFAPFSGSANVGLVASEDLAGLRPTRTHRYFDSLVTAATSTMGFLQLFTLTAVASLATVEGGRTGALLFTWFLWPTLIALSAAEGWLIELVHRTYGPQARRIIAVTLLTLIATAVLLDPRHGSTLFGLGTLYADTLETAGAGKITETLTAMLVILVLSGTLLIVGLVACRAALNKPAGSTVFTRDRRLLFPMSTNPTLAMLQVLLAQANRTREVRRPLATILIMAVPAVWISGGAEAVMTTLVIAIPISVALSWGINTFGVIGPAMPWFASQPHLMRRLLGVIVATQIAITLLVWALVWVPPALVGRVNIADIAAVAAGSVVSTMLATRSAAAKSVHRPYLARLGSRGDVIVPPLTSVNYTLRFLIWAGQLGVLTMSEGDRMVQLSLVTVAFCWATSRFVFLLRAWRDPALQAHVTAQVAAA